jgi:lysophospholipase L1-like esterase
MKILSILLACAFFSVPLVLGAQNAAPASIANRQASQEKTGVILAATPGTASTAAIPERPQKVDASAAVDKGSPGFHRRHDSFVERGKSGPIGILLLGDSITEGWRKAPHIYEHYFGKWEPANFGISGDQTQHVIWRIENGEFDGAHPKVVVLMLGTNNTSDHTAEEIAAADQKIITLIRAHSPETKVLLLAIFPRGARKDAQGTITNGAIADATKRMAVIRDTNALLAKLDDGVNVRFLDINGVFLGQDGKIPWAIMPDQLHPTAAGYQLWAEAMQAPLVDMIKAK